MTAEQFAYWLQGYAELTGDQPPSAEQWASIREHLQLVFKKVTPPVLPATKPLSQIDAEWPYATRVSNPPDFLRTEVIC